MEITNKTLALLLVAAIAVTVFGTVFSVNKLSNFGRSTTGFATQGTGTAQLNISSTASIKMISNSINFGTGSVNTTDNVFNNCTLRVNGTDASPETERTAGGCDGFTDTDTQIPFVVENDGNIDLNLTIEADGNATYTIGGGGVGHPEPEFQFLVTNNETGSCSTGLPTGWLNVSQATQNVCADFNWNPASTDSLAIGVRVLIPDNANLGTKTVTFILTGSS